VNQFGLTFKDITWDAIPELFKRNEEGLFFELKEYFERNNITEKSDSEIWILLRRLVFSVVNHRLYRLNKIYDPALGKIIRNMKLHIKSSSNLGISVFFETTIIHLKDYKILNEPLPEIQPEFLESEFFSRISNINSLPEMLIIICNILSELENYRKTFPLVEAAIIIRKAFTMNHNFDLRYNSDDILSESEIEHFIKESVNSIQHTMESYINKGKLNQQQAAIYVKAIKVILQNDFIKEENQDSYFTIVKKYFPELTKEVYLKEHREIIEYLAKIAKNQLRTLLKKEFNSP
jgi:hypothetical protein